MQALFLLALDPIAETTADGGSYGFRGMRRCGRRTAGTLSLLRKLRVTGRSDNSVQLCWLYLILPGKTNH